MERIEPKFWLFLTLECTKRNERVKTPGWAEVTPWTGCEQIDLKSDTDRERKKLPKHPLFVVSAKVSP